MSGRGRSGASTNLLSDGVAVAGPGAVRRSEPESCATFGIRVVLRGRHRRTADGDEPDGDHTRSHERADPAAADPSTDLPRHRAGLVLPGTDIGSRRRQPDTSSGMARRGRCGTRGRRAIEVHPDRRRKRLALARFGRTRTQRLIDPRIAAAARRIREDPATTVSSRELAAEAGLSESRFLHLFRDELGTSLRRYRIWVRLVHAGTAIAAGANMTEAAMKSGFASPSHLADRFKSTFGLSASQLLGTGLTVRTP